jgi:glycosyltransferase involved in cell wall biosynthesis
MTRTADNTPDAVSVAMATYNGARYLPEQLDSLAGQTLPPAELVVADDGSTDDTLSVLHEFARRSPFPVRVLPPEPHAGYVAAFLRAAAAARYAHIAYADQDDVWRPTKLARCVQWLRQPEVMLVIHAGATIDAAGGLLGVRLPAVRRRQILPAGSLRDGPLATFPLGFALVFRRAVAEAVLPRLHAYPDPCARLFGHEFPMVWTARGLGRVAFLDEALVLYRRHDANVTRGGGRPGKGVAEMAGQGASEYLDFAAHASRQADCLEWLAGQDAGPPAPYYRDLAAIRRQLSELLERRARLYAAARRSDRWRAWWGIVRDDGYRPRYRGGLGWRSLAKDTVHMLR